MALRAQVRFRAGDIWDTPDDGNRYEVIDGVLYVTPAPSWTHQNASINLGGLLWHHVRERQLGKVATAPVALVLDEENGLQPDLVYISRERLHIITERAIEGPPDLVVEILSARTRSRDRGIKMRRYAAAGVPHYWLLDPRSRSLEPYRLTERGYEREGTFGPGSTFHPDLFPGLAISIDDLWS
ncbi:MAG: Uma2 family endonuclease [Chloroflexi bacterium]|nr:Uma2 family endonuclease [Chloroflexota bacterium]